MITRKQKEWFFNMKKMKDYGLLDCEDRPSIEENFKRVVKNGTGGGGGGDLLETVETEVPLEITWDGDIDGKEMFDSGDGNNTYFVKISDVILTKEQMLNAVTIDPSTNEELILTEEKIVDAAEVGLPALMGGSYISSVYSSLDMGNGIALSTGLYFYYIDSDSYVTHLTCPNATTTTTKQQLKPSLIPYNEIIEKVLEAIPSAKGVSF
jgi:hypothetical protein